MERWNGMERWSGMERNGMSAALATHVLQPTTQLHHPPIVTMIAIASQKCGK